MQECLLRNITKYHIFFLRVQSLISWIFYILIGGNLIWLLTRFYSIKVYNKNNLKELKPPFILVSNHLTLIDTLFIHFVISWPSYYIRPWRLLWNLPEQTNYFRGIILPYMWLSRCIPIQRQGKARDQLLALEKAISVLNNHESIHIFPEGTRSRTGRITDYTTGIGRIYLKVPNCTILPVYARGIENVLPIKAKFPRLWKKIDVVIGKPTELNTPHKGIRALKDVSLQIFNLLVDMENDYFQSDKNRSKEILEQSK